MSDETTKVLGWEPPMPPTDLIFDDGEPLETNRHRITMNTLIRSLQQAWRDLPNGDSFTSRNDFFCGNNITAVDMGAKKDLNNRSMERGLALLLDCG